MPRSTYLALLQIQREAATFKGVNRYFAKKVQSCLQGQDASYLIDIPEYSTIASIIKDESLHSSWVDNLQAPSTCVTIWYMLRYLVKEFEAVNGQCTSIDQIFLLASQLVSRLHPIDRRLVSMYLRCFHRVYYKRFPPGKWKGGTGSTNHSIALCHLPWSTLVSGLQYRNCNALNLSNGNTLNNGSPALYGLSHALNAFKTTWKMT